MHETRVEKHRKDSFPTSIGRESDLYRAVASPSYNELEQRLTAALSMVNVTAETKRTA